MKPLGSPPSFRRKPESILFKTSRHWTPIFIGVTTKKRFLHRASSGFTLFEVILVIVILLIAIVPMMDAFRPALFATSAEERRVIFTNCVRQTLYRALSTNYGDLEKRVNRTETIKASLLFGNSDDNCRCSGGTYDPDVKIDYAAYDAQNNPFLGLLTIRVTIDEISLEALKADY